MFQTVTNFLFSRPSIDLESKKSNSNNNLKSFKSFNDLSDLKKKKGEPKVSNDCCSPGRPFSCDLPFIVSDEYNMFCPPPEFSQNKKEMIKVKIKSAIY